jgi:hypothetical protein
MGVAMALWFKRSPFLAGLCSSGMTLMTVLTIMAAQSVLRARLQIPLLHLAHLYKPLQRYRDIGL